MRPLDEVDFVLFVAFAICVLALFACIIAYQFV